MGSSIQDEYKKNIAKIFEDAGCELLSEFINRRTKVEFKCSCGGLGSIRLDSFQAGTRCRECLSDRIKNSVNKEEAKDKKKQNNIEKHGVEHYFQSDEFKEKIKKSVIDTEIPKKFKVKLKAKKDTNE
jgi:hypothetical protein